MPITIVDEFTGSSTATYNFSRPLQCGDAIFWGGVGDPTAFDVDLDDSGFGDASCKASSAYGSGSMYGQTSKFSVKPPDYGKTSITITATGVLFHYVGLLEGVGCRADGHAGIATVLRSTAPFSDPCDIGITSGFFPNTNLLPARGQENFALIAVSATDTTACSLSNTPLLSGFGSLSLVYGPTTGSPGHAFYKGVYTSDLNPEVVGANQGVGDKWAMCFIGVPEARSFPEVDCPSPYGGGFPDSVFDGDYIVDNQCMNGTNGIVVSGMSNLTMSRNRVHGMSQNGTSLTNVAYSTVGENQVYFNDQHGMYFDDCNNLKITANDVKANSSFTDNTYDGIILDTLCEKNSLTGNTVNKDISNRHRYGIRINAASDNLNTVVGNDLRFGGATANLSDAGTATTSTANAV